jgi:tripartite-type tricarboxylate transporter receptor subunit TctC
MTRECAPVRRLRGLLAALIVAGLCTVAQAQPYPTRSIKLVVPFAPGGAVDVPARLLAQRLSISLGQSVFIENKSGAGGTIGATAVAHAEPDGYTLLCGSSGSLAVSPALYGSAADYDAQKSFAPIALLSNVPYILLVAPSVPVSSLGELIAYAKADPTRVNFGAPSGTPSLLLEHLFKKLTGADVTIVTYRGGGPVLNDLLGGQIQATFETTSVAMAHLRADKLRALAVATPERLAALPDVPTTAESGVGQLTAYSWTGVVAPAGTPAEVVNKLNTAINAVLASPAMQADLAKLGSVTRLGSPADFAHYIAEERHKWGELVRESGARAD